MLKALDLALLAKLIDPTFRYDLHRHHRLLQLYLEQKLHRHCEVPHLVIIDQKLYLKMWHKLLQLGEVLQKPSQQLMLWHVVQQYLRQIFDLEIAAQIYLNLLAQALLQLKPLCLFVPYQLLQVHH